MISISQRRTISRAGPAILVAALLNNWFLAFFLNFRLLAHGGDISSFGALTQPRHSLFHDLDIAGGIGLIGLGIYLWQDLKKLGLRFGGQLLILLGLGSIADAKEPLACTRQLDTNCNIPLKVNFDHPLLPHHFFSSTLIVVCLVLLPYLAIRSRKIKISLKLYKLGYFSLGSSALFLIMLFLSSMFGGLFLIHAQAITQMIQMIIFGLWFIYLWIFAKAEASQTTNPRG